MADTFIVTDEPEFPYYSQELPNTAVTGHPYLKHIAPMALMNPPGSGKVLRVKEVKVRPANAQTLTGSGGTAYELRRITAHTPGEDTQVAIKMDSANADMPSQVVFARYPLSVTTTGDVLDVAVKAFQANVTRALARAWAAMPYQRRLRDMYSDVVEMQRITIREGEGVSVSVPSNSVSQPWRWWVQFGVREATSGECYRYQFPVGNQGMPVFSLFNGAGSGVVLEIYHIAFQEIGTDEMPLLAVEQIDGLDPLRGQALTPISMDSENDIGTVFARRNSAIEMMGSNSGALITIPHREWFCSIVSGVGPGYANIMVAFDRFHNHPAPLMDVVLHEGEGIAITRKNASALDRNHYSIIFSVTDGEVIGSVTETFKNSSDVNLPDGTVVNAYHASTYRKVGTGKIRSGVATVPVSTLDDVYLVADPAGLSGETVCSTAITPSAL